MSTTGFSVTFERYLPHDPEEDVCEPDERGFVVEGVSFRDALQQFSGCGFADYATADDADEWPIQAPRWFTLHKWNDGTHEYFCEGITEDRSLHLPDSITPASRRRIARLLGLTVAQPAPVPPPALVHYETQPGSNVIRLSFGIKVF